MLDMHYKLLYHTYIDTTNINREINIMKKIDGRIKIGTRVKIKGLERWQTVVSIDATKLWIKLEEYVGLFQRGHIETFANKYN